MWPRTWTKGNAPGGCEGLLGDKRGCEIHVFTHCTTLDVSRESPSVLLQGLSEQQPIASWGQVGTQHWSSGCLTPPRATGRMQNR